MNSLLPNIIQYNFEKGQNSGNFEAFALFIDLSGFTPMTETLLQRGTSGAEVLSKILNNIFEPLVESVYAEGGFIPYFAGDAFHAIFPKRHIGGLELLSLARKFTNKFIGHKFSEEFEIRCKIGLSFGNVEWGIVGAQYKSFYFRGEAIERSAEGQSKAAAQEIVFDEKFDSNLPIPVEKEIVGAGFFRLGSFEVTDRENLQHIESKPLSFEIGKIFLPESILEFNQSGEFREVVSVFISFKGVKTHAELDSFATKVLDQVHNFSGYFKEIEFGDKGGVMLVFFGAPLSYENNGQRALEFSLSVVEEVSSHLELSVSIGISSGLAYTGLIGGKQRCQYGAVGSRVNLAARLMMEAGKNQIFTDLETSKVKGFSYSYHGNISYKGIAADIPTYLLFGKKSEEDRSYVGAIVGRNEEMQRLYNFAVPILTGKFSGVATIFGEPGIGKSRLCYELKKKLGETKEIDYLVCQSDQILQKPFNPFIYALKNCFDQSGDKSLKENKVFFEIQFEKLIEQLLDSTHPKADAVIKELIRSKSILGGLIGIILEDTLWSQLDAKGRHENTISAIINFFYARAIVKPLLIELEDWHWTDNETASILPEFIVKLKSFPVLLIVTSRYQDDGEKPIIFSPSFYFENGIDQIEIDLNTLSSEAIQVMAGMRLGAPIDSTFLEFIQRSCNGNPFYIEQILEYFTESSLLVKNDNCWTIKDSTMKLSGSINAVLMARVDRLSYLVKETVKAAAVIGREFEVPVLSEVMSRQGEFLKLNGNQRTLLQEQILTAEKSQIWWAINEIRYIFKHSLLREAVYEMQLGTRLRDLHKLIAEAIEHVYKDSIEERYVDLAFHYEQADVINLTVKYLEKAAEFARRNFQNMQALTFYEKLIDYYKKDAAANMLLKALLQKGKIEQLMGAWNDAEKTFYEALVLSTSTDDRLLAGRSKNALGSVLMMKGNYVEAKQYFERALELFEFLDDAIGKSKSFANLANLSFRQGQYEEAKNYFLQSMLIIRKVDEKRISPQNIATLGLTYMNLNKYDEGILSIQKFLPVAEEQNDKQGLASLHTNLGIIFYEKGDYDSALLHYKEGLALSEELGNKLLESIALGCIGSVYENKGDFGKAKKYFEKDLQLTESLGDRQGIAIAFGLLGTHYALIGEFEKALGCLEPNLKLCEELGYQKGIIKSLNTLAQVSFYQGNFKEAILYYERSITVAKKIKNHLLQGLSMIELSYAYIENNEWQLAMELKQEMEEHLEIVTKRSMHFGYQMLCATLYIISKKYEKAEEILQRAMEQDHLSSEEEAAVFYQFATLHPDSANWQLKVIKQYQALYETTPKYLYKYRIEKLSQ